MTKVQSGATLIGVAIGVNVLGRLLMRAAMGGHSVPLAAFVTIVMLTSAVLGLFGLFRLIVGMKDRN